MIAITCDACNERFEVADNAAGTTVKCPKCGARNGVPAAEGVPARTENGDKMPRGEQVLIKAHPAMFRARPARFTLLLLVFLGGLAGAGYFLTASKEPVIAIACGVGALVGLVPLLLWKIAAMGTSLTVTTSRTIETTGLLSKSSTEVRHEDIKNLQISQTFQQRIFNVGSIGISSAGQDDIEILARDFPKPYRIREVIDEHRKF